MARDVMDVVQNVSIAARAAVRQYVARVAAPTVKTTIKPPTAGINMNPYRVTIMREIINSPHFGFDIYSERTCIAECEI